MTQEISKGLLAEFKRAFFNVDGLRMLETA